MQKCEMCPATLVTVVVYRSGEREREPIDFCSVSCLMRWAIRTYAQETTLVRS
jgi:hypothetical protein